VGYSGPFTPSADVLCELAQAQVFTIPFENLDIHLGRSIQLDPAALIAKLVQSRRGGYCYELNGLFRLVLERLGFTVQCLAGRNIMTGPPFPQKSHQMLLVTIAGQPWLVDLGFGGNGLLAPLPLEPGREVGQFFARFRLIADPYLGYVLQAGTATGWQPLYAFTLEEYQPRDYVMMNYYNSTHPESTFTRRRMAARPTLTGRVSLNNDELKIRQGDALVTTLLPDDEAVRAALATHFDIHLSADLAFLPLPD
jgi:N-hydroxyarylamine O-acetyltransferase